MSAAHEIVQCPAARPFDDGQRVVVGAGITPHPIEMNSNQLVEDILDTLQEGDFALIGPESLPAPLDQRQASLERGCRLVQSPGCCKQRPSPQKACHKTSSSPTCSPNLTARR